MNIKNHPRLLDLFCCAGGAAVGYARAGFEVVGVDIAFQKNYPFEFHQGDALAYVTEHGHEFDVIHASPPCQHYSTLTRGNRGRGEERDHPDLVAATREALEAVGKPYIIENVASAPLRQDVTLRGLMFGLKVFRHRLFEAGGWTVEPIAHPSHKGHRVAGWNHGVKHDGDMFAVYGEGGGKGTVEQWQAAMGIGHTRDRRELAEAIPPAFTEHLGRQLLAHLQGA